MSALMPFSLLLQVGHAAFEEQGSGFANDFRNPFKDIFDDNVMNFSLRVCFPVVNLLSFGVLNLR